jgi:hypothetical protein
MLMQAQNLVPNNGFETNDGTPTGYGQWYHATGWSDVNNYPAFLWPYASPDYLHNTGAGGADLPICTFATVSPFAGNAIMGFITWLQSTPEFREYLSITLSSPMVVGTAYNVSFWITNGSAGWYNGYSSNFVYTPDAAYDQITIGNFYADAATAHTFHAAAMSAGSYYFIDEVVVEPVAPLPIELLSFQADQQDETVSLQWHTASEWHMDAFHVMRSTDGYTFDRIGTISATGGPNSPASYTFIDDDPVEGNNYYFLELAEEDGSTDSSGVESVWFTRQNSEPVIYPNPASGSFVISGLETGKLAAIHISDLSGRLLLDIDGGSSSDHMIIDKLPKGTYIITIYYDTTSYNYIQIIE